MKLCVVRGCGDIGSAVAHALFSKGHAVVIHDLKDPCFARRGMSFTDAMYEGSAQLEGVEGRWTGDIFSVRHMLEQVNAVPLVSLSFSKVIEYLRPCILIDARMNKRSIPDRQLGLAPLSIGLGPNFIAGETTDIVVETAWEGLGTIITEGSSQPLCGEPRPINGYGRERYVYAPAEGRFETDYEIGTKVSIGQPIACIDNHIVKAPLDGCLRGLTHPGASVRLGTKVVEIDPRGDATRSFGIAERPQKLADSVLGIIRQYRRNPPRGIAKTDIDAHA